MDPITIAIAGYQIYSVIAFASKTVDWVGAHYKISQLEHQMDQLAHLRPASIGHPEWAKADGYFDQRRRPFPAMRHVLESAKEACTRKDQGMLIASLSKLVPGGEIMDALTSGH
mmetsp:Transcript_3340/g.8737  ORF Transcript_3340/g.8737 Transcript_3340/m.8737 type:complete len:114 (-) Transcript_3340:304-645(-)